MENIITQNHLTAELFTVTCQYHITQKSKVQCLNKVIELIEIQGGLIDQPQNKITETR
jgi:hypothetical protein